MAIGRDTGETTQCEPACASHCREITEPEPQPLAQPAKQELAALSLLRQVIDSVHAGIVVYGLDLRCQLWNRHMERLSGKKASLVIGKKPRDVFPFFAEAGHIAHLERALVGETPPPMEYRIDVDGREIWLLDSSAPLRDEAGQVSGVLATVQDITEQKRAEERLENTVERLQLATTSAGVGIWDWDIEKNVLVWDDRMYELYGLSRASFAGAYEAWLSGLHPDDSARCHAESEAVRAGTGDYQSEFRVVWPNGTVRHLRALGRVILDSAGKPVRMIGTNFDVTARSEAESKARDALELNKQIMEASQLVILVYDGQSGQCSVANESAARFLGASLETVSGLNFSELSSWKEHGLLEVAERVLATGATAHQTFSGRSSFGRDVWMDAILSRITANQRHYLLVMALDVTAQKQAEMTLRDSEEKFRYLFEHSVVGKSLTLPTGEVQVNQALADLLGFTLQELKGRRWQDLTHPDDIAMTQRQIDRLTSRESESARFTKRFLRKDGSVIWTELLSSFRWSADGRPLHLVTSILDITSQRRAADILAARTRLLEFATNHSSEDILRYMLDEIEGVTSSTLAVCDLLSAEQVAIPPRVISTRASAESVVVRDLLGHFGPTTAMPDGLGDGRAIIHNDAATLPYWAGFSTVVRELLFPLLRGSQVVAIVGVANKDTAYVEGDLQTVAEIANVGYEAAERKRAEEALRESEYHYRTLLEAVTDMIFVLTINPDGTFGNFVEANDVTCHALGYSIDELRRLSIGDIDAPHSDGGVDPYPTFGELSRGREVALRQVHVAKDGRRIPVEIHARPFVYHGRSAIFALARDISERVRAEAEKVSLMQQLHQSQKMESVGRLAGGVAHDFNNMLGVILGHTELVLQQLEPNQPLYGDLLAVQQAAERSADLTRQLLAFARSQTVSPKTLDLNETIESMLKILHRLIGEDIELVWRPGPDAAFVKIDPSQVDQILANLCVNARDAISSNGRVTIETDCINLDEEHCALDTGLVPGEYVELAVSDNGCGIGRETQEHLFEPFFTTKEVGKGTGLGLAMVFGIVQQNHGFIQVDSELGRGTTFKIYLPRRRIGSVLPARSSSGIRATGSETILLVEDAAAFRVVIERMLRQLGYSVISASSPGEAIQLARENAGRIDLILTDVVMPEMNGRELAKSLQSLLPDIKYLFMSGYTANVIAHHGVLDDSVQFLQKPFSVDVLAGKIREVLDKR